MPQGRQLLWGAAWGVDLLWFIIGALASNTFLVAGAVIYGLVLIAFLAAEVRPAPDDEPSVSDDPE
jgi:hypothetical protein